MGENIDEERQDLKSKELLIRKENPFSLFQRMDSYYDDLIKGFFNNWYWPFKFMRSGPLSLNVMETKPFFRTPLANISEDEDQFQIIAEVPGLEKTDIEICLNEGTIEIKGEVREERKEENESDLIRKEFREASYYRCFSLPENTDEEAIEAEFDNGILKLTIPKIKPKKVKSKKIEIK